MRNNNGLFAHSLLMAILLIANLSDRSSQSRAIAQTPNAVGSPEKRSGGDRQDNSGTIILGIVILSGGCFAYRKYRSSKKHRQQQMTRFEEEFACSPIADRYAARLNLSQPTVPPKEPKLTSQIPVEPSEPSASTPTNVMPEPNPLQQQYQAFIEEIITLTLNGKIRSKDHVHTLLVDRLKLGTGEIFERCLEQTQSQIQLQLNNSSTQAKAERQLRALATLQGAWERWQKDREGKTVMQHALGQLLSVPPQESLLTLLEILDPNQNHPFSQTQIEQLAKALKQQAELTTEPTQKENLPQLATGLERGLQAFRNLELNLMSWIYHKPESLGFAKEQQQREPWRTWAQEVTSPLARQLFELQSFNQSAAALVQSDRHLSSWIELAVILRELQRALINWFDRQPYSAKWGKQSSCSTFIIFAVIWCELSNGFNSSDRQQLGRACFQMTIQLLRTFAQRADFPLYGGIFASFSGEHLRDTLSYLDEPLRSIENTQEKGRILTLLGYSQKMLGRYEPAIDFHHQALEIARGAEDCRCEIANLNHLSRIRIEQKDFEGAIGYSQRALMLARQKGDRLGEAHGLANLGYSEVLAAHRQEQMDSEIYERSIAYLQEALKLSEHLNDAFAQEQAMRQTQALCCNSLGIAHLILEQPQTAIEYLERGSKALQGTGDLYLQGLNLTYTAEAHYSLDDRLPSIYHACVAMYLLERIAAREWRQSAGLLTVWVNKLGQEAFNELLQEQRAELIAAIGYDGFAHLPQLLEQYRQSD